MDSPQVCETAVIKKIARRILPLILVAYCVAYIDRANIAVAALTMNKDLGLSAFTYGLGAGIFFVGCFIFEVPSNLILERVGARRWIARIMFTWGLLSAACAFVTGMRILSIWCFAIRSRLQIEPKLCRRAQCLGEPNPRYRQ
jgi:MFS transporter, ACS family, tartrate transporter